LYDRICRDDILWVAWERVRANRGAAGVDKQTLADISRIGPGIFLAEIRADLQSGRYRPSAVRRQYIPKSDGKPRDPRACPSGHAGALRRRLCDTTARRDGR